MTIYVYGSRAARTAENRDLREFVRRLLTPWSGEDRSITLIANSLWNGAEIDLVCLLPQGILIADFKDYAGHVTGGENGRWLLDGTIEIKGGNKANPFQQLRDNKFSVLSWIKDHRLLDGRDIGRIGATVVFRGPVTQELDLSGRVRPWFHATDLDHCAELLNDIASPKLNVYQRDIDAIVRAAGVERLPAFEGVRSFTGAVPPVGGVGAAPTVQHPVKPTPEVVHVSTSSSTSAPQVEASPIDESSASTRKPQRASDPRIDAPPPPIAVSRTASPPNAVVRNESRRTPAADAISIAPTPPVAAAGPGSTGAATPAHPDTKANIDSVDAAQRGSSTTNRSVDRSRVYPHRVRWAPVYLGAAAVILAASIAFTPLFMRASSGSVPAAPPTGPAPSSASDVLTTPLGDSAGNAPEPSTIPQPNPTDQPPRIDAREAPFYVGKTVMACGEVAQVRDFRKGTYLNLVAPYPHEALVLIVWDQDVGAVVGRFGNLAGLQGRRACGLGRIVEHRAHLQLSIENAQFLRLMHQ